MTDREKVIEMLGKVSCFFKSLLAVGWQCDADTYREYRESVNMAIALLKEQEPVRPTNTLDGNGHMWRDCGKCGGILPKNAQYCPTCGRKVKWDD